MIASYVTMAVLTGSGIVAAQSGESGPGKVETDGSLADIDMPLPFTKGMWEASEPLAIDLKEGRNHIMFNCRAPNRGISIKGFELTPAN